MSCSSGPGRFGRSLAEEDAVGGTDLDAEGEKADALLVLRLTSAPLNEAYCSVKGVGELLYGCARVSPAERLFADEFPVLACRLCVSGDRVLLEVCDGPNEML